MLSRTTVSRRVQHQFFLSQNWRKNGECIQGRLPPVSHDANRNTFPRPSTRPISETYVNTPIHPPLVFFWSRCLRRGRDVSRRGRRRTSASPANGPSAWRNTATAALWGASCYGRRGPRWLLVSSWTRTSDSVFVRDSLRGGGLHLVFVGVFPRVGRVGYGNHTPKAELRRR